jgi:hypothetical protein
MKHNIYISTLVTLLLGVFADNVLAQLGPPSPTFTVQPVTISLNMVQQTGTNDNGTNVTFITKQQSYSNQQFLQLLARDENAVGNYPNTNFPAGAKLAFIYGAFQVVDRTNGLLLDVSDMLSFSQTSSNVVAFGRYNEMKVLTNPTTSLGYIGRLDFDDTAYAGALGLKFYLQGPVKGTLTDLLNTKAETLTAIIQTRLSNGWGDGTWNGKPLMVSGTLELGGRQTEPLVAPGSL